MAEPLLQAQDLVVRYGRNPALEGVSLAIQRGETLALVGPSGSGKSTLARALLRLHPLESGTIRFDGGDWLALSGRALRKRRAHMQMVFQDPLSAFNPRANLRDLLHEPLRIHRIRRDISELLQRSGSIRPWQNAAFTRFPAGSASAWRLPARLRRRRRSSCWTRPFRRSMSPCAAQFSIFCGIYRKLKTRPIFSSRTTLPWRRRWPTVSR